MISRVYSALPDGFGGQIVEVETDSSKGLPSFQIVGMANRSIEESKERVRSAITNSQLTFPAKKLTINLAPAEIPKDGAYLDLPIAISILINSKQILQQELDKIMLVGELSLDGKLRAVKGIVGITQTAKENGFQDIIMPFKNTNQAKLIDGINIYGANNLQEVFVHLKKIKRLNLAEDIDIFKNAKNHQIILDDINSQDHAKRALIIAAAGRHNLLFNGPPGTGKTMLAKCIPSLLPMPTKAEIIEITKLHSLSDLNNQEIITERPFRSPHHTASRTSLIGGGNKPKPGEISLSHLGVLFLDELPEYPKTVIEALRQPLEDKEITIDRVGGRAKYPADFMLVATMNPCPCGFYGDDKHQCTCSTSQILNYQKKISGPMLDRIDLVLNVGRIPNDDLLKKSASTNQQENALNLISNAIKNQRNRYKSSTFYNSNLTTKLIKETIKLDDSAKDLLSKASEKMSLSPRSYYKIIKVAQTIADLENSEIITAKHIAESLQYKINLFTL